MNENLKQGALTELKCQIYLIANDCIVSKPIVDNARYDLLLDKNNKIYKIQVKTSRWNIEGETIVFNCKSSHAVSKGNKILKYSPDEIDFFMTEWENKFYLIPCEEKRNQFTLRLIESPNTQFISEIHWAKDYLAEEVLKTL